MTGVKDRLLDAAMMVIRTKGYSAASVEDICQAAGVTKGSFFHYFKSKEELALGTASYFASMAEGLFAQAPYRQLADPVDRLIGYVDFRIEILQGTLPQFTCLLGTMMQEVYITHPAIRDACEQHMSDHIDVLIRDIDLAKEARHIRADWSSESLGYYIQSVIQGAFIYAKAKGGTAHAVESLTHLRRYIASLFDPSASYSLNKAA